MQSPLATVGNVNVDLILGPLSPWPVPGSEVLCPDSDLRVGGAAGNVALTWRAWNLPFQCASSTGDDHFGDWLRAGFGSTADHWSRTSGSTTISVGVTHPDAERTFLTTVGHLPEFSWSDVERQLDWDALRGGTIILCGSFLTERLSADYGRLFDRAAQEQIAIALDTGWPIHGWNEETRARALHWVARSQIVLLNEIEATSLTATATPEAALESLARHQPKSGISVVKLGPKGAIARQHAKTIRAIAPQVGVKDTIGAGDVFNAAFIASLSQCTPLAQALDHAVATASLAVSTNPRCYIHQEVSV
jgi:sugar/nucleoside kinase (ribokinase family)